MPPNHHPLQPTSMSTRLHRPGVWSLDQTHFSLPALCIAQAEQGHAKRSKAPVSHDQGRIGTRVEDISFHAVILQGFFNLSISPKDRSRLPRQHSGGESKVNVRDFCLLPRGRRLSYCPWMIYPSDLPHHPPVLKGEAEAAQPSAPDRERCPTKNITKWLN